MNKGRSALKGWDSGWDSQARRALALLWLALSWLVPAALAASETGKDGAVGSASAVPGLGGIVNGGPASGADGHGARPGKGKTPNILLFIMDDVGIDQMRVFGYGGATAPRTPNIDAIAKAGVRFRNTWAMPECSPSRTAVFTGRFPLRTGVEAVITQTTLANSQVSPFEVTVPKVLHNAGYQSALFGKFHMGGPYNYPFGNGGPHHAIGFDYYHGFIEGEPYPIDTWAGFAPPAGSTNPGPYGCGFVEGPATGVCRFAGGACEPGEGTRPGLACVAKGGVFEANGNCTAAPPANLDFKKANAYYVSPLVINRPDGAVEAVELSDPRARGYRTTIEVDAARDWIRSLGPRDAWMATVAFSAAHVPYQPPPPALEHPGEPGRSANDCSSNGALRVLSNQTIEALDAELGRLLVELGIASRSPAGDLIYDPAASNTMIVILGDNGSYAPVVKVPFDSLHSKGTVYQTGVWVPLIVSGPLVRQPDREVAHMVNVADLFALFGEIADLDVRREVPRSHTLDAVSMLPYLTNPRQASLRRTNYTEVGTALTPPGTPTPPCVVTVEQTQQACVELFPSQDICVNEAGTWYGEGAPTPYGSCCELANAQVVPGLVLLPAASRAIRNDRFKLVQQAFQNCSGSNPPTTLRTEFYAIDEAPVSPRLDRPDNDQFPNNLLPNGADPSTLPPPLRAQFSALDRAMQALLASEVPCPGDGNLDKKVNSQDLVDYGYYRLLSNGQSSWYDLNLDGLTDSNDRVIIEQNLGTRCHRQGP